MSGPYAEFESAPQADGVYVEVRWPCSTIMAAIHREYVAATAERALHAAVVRRAAEDAS